MSQARMILCLGPHRSGTSTVTAALQALGADLALGEAYANDENAKGFFEQPEILAFDEALMAALGAAWDAADFDCRAAMAGRDMAPWQAQAAALLARLWPDGGLAAMKDPRQCQLLPFWLPVLEAAGFAVDSVHVLRDPVEVAISQRTRALRRPEFYDIGRFLPEGAALWLSASCQMWQGIGAGRHVMLAYDRLVDAPEATLQALAGALDLTPDPGQVSAFLSGFIDPGLRRSRDQAGARAEIDAALPQAGAAFARMLPLADLRALSPGDVAPLASLWQEAATRDAVARVMAPAAGRLAGRHRLAELQAARLADELAEAARAQDDLRGEMAQLQSDVARDRAAREADYAQAAARAEADFAAERARLLAEAEADARARADGFARERAALEAAFQDRTARAEADFAAERAALLAEVEADRQARQAAHVAALADLDRDLRAEADRALADQAAHLRAEAEAALAAQAADQAAREAGIVRDYQAELDRLVRDYQGEAARLTAAFQTELAQQSRALAALAADLAAREAQIAGIHGSLSWWVSKPVRVGGRALRRGQGALRRGLAQPWIRLNHLARRVYRGLAARSPGLAEALRVVAAPLLHRGNRALLRRDYVPAAEMLTAPSLDHPMGQLAYQRPRAQGDHRPLVTVIVPNYNHAPYLVQRLDSVFGQTYPNVEVILMDDCSKDDSRAILQSYADRYPDRTRVIFNDTNSGGAFFQWEKGIRAARGELIWVAESDDWCSPNFLDTLVPFFANPAVQMAYCPTVFMNKDGTEQTWSMREYLSDLGPERWDHPFVLPAPIIVREAFAARNIIPNVSSAVFRRPDRLEVLENAIWRGMRTSGDWVLYLNLIRGGLLAYSPAAQSFFRQHGGNTSVGSFTQDRYYAEHEEVAKCVQRHYRVDAGIFARQQADLKAHWLRNRGSLDSAAFDACYSLERIAAARAEARPHLMMAGFAFAAGGGETFPIALANLMKTAGYTVTFLDCHQLPEQAGIRQQLARDIPVVTNFEDLNGILRDFDIEVIHSHNAWVDNTILDLVPEDSPLRTVITLHGMYETIPEPQLKRMLPRLVRRTAGMVYIAEKNTEAVVGLGGMARDRLVKIDNALPPGPGTPLARADLGLPEAALVLVIVSRGIAEKGWEEAIAAVGQARRMARRDIRLVIVGDGPEYDRLSPRAPDYVHFAGFRGNTRDYFATGDLGLLPSRFKGESFPLVLIDCLNAGRPMLATDLGEVRAMLAGEGGLAGEVLALEDWTVPVAELARRIAALADDPAALAAMTARVPSAVAKFDPVRMRDAYDAVYRAAMGPGRGAGQDGKGQAR